VLPDRRTARDPLPAPVLFIPRDPSLRGYVTRIAVQTRSSREQAVSDVALLERVAEGDVRALSELAARHCLSLRALAFGILRDAVEAEQIVQATFREVRYEAGRFDPAHFPVFGWLAEVTRVGALQRSRVRAGLPEILS